MIISVEDNLLLETVEPAHSFDIFNLIESNRNYLREWLPWVDKNISLNDTIGFIEYSQQQYLSKEGLNCVIKLDQKIVGMIGLHRIDGINKITSIGYWIGESFQGKGIITKSCRALVDFCFNSLGLNKIEIECGTANNKSQAIPQRLNFKMAGLKKQAVYLNGRHVDHYLYTILKEEWINELSGKIKVKRK
jgi:ribosomal-protein-serine acetyltransferase